MEELIITAEHKQLAFTNKELQNATMAIYKIAENIRTRWFEIAAIVAMVDVKELYKDDGFADVHEWVNKTFAFGKSTSYDLLKVGREYVREVTNKAGKVIGYESNLVPVGADNFSTTQVRRMLPAGHELASELVESGEITPDMTTTKIAKIVKAHLSPESSESTGDEEEGGEETTEDEAEKLRRVFDKISTADLIKELTARGFIVYDKEGREMKV
jgi:hypothetical protein